MQIIDPIPFLGIDSGMRRLTVTKAEAAALLRAAALVDRAHDLVEGALGDGHFEMDGANLCETPECLRTIAAGEVEW